MSPGANHSGRSRDRERHYLPEQPQNQVVFPADETKARDPLFTQLAHILHYLMVVQCWLLQIRST
jgi:hypothetical protein